MIASRRILWPFVVVAGLVGCTGSETLRPLRDGDVTEQGTLELPAVVWAQNPRTQLKIDEVHAYALPLSAGAAVRLELRAGDCGGGCAPITPVLYLLDAGAQVVAARSGGADEGAVIEHTATRAETYQIRVASLDGAGPYDLDAYCDSGACTAGLTFAETREPAADEILSDHGAYLFRHVYRVSEGLGNQGTRQGPAYRPNFNKVHLGPFGGPDSQSCVSCHNVGGVHGGGTFDDNIFQGGDGVDERQALQRNPPAVRGLGAREAIGRELTAKLLARFGEMTESGELCVPNYEAELCFGRIEVGPTGEKSFPSDFSFIDTDLVVKPFGWKGREATLRGFVQGGFRVHFGLQAEGPIKTHCDKLASGEAVDLDAYQSTWGQGDCPDPDDDGIAREITNRQLDAMSVYLQDIEPPPPSDPGYDGPRATFDELGCARCHTPRFRVADMTFTDPDTGVEMTLDPSGGEIANVFEVWSDFRRHNLGKAHADRVSFPHSPSKIPAVRFITSPLWDLARSAPYMHDGRAETVDDAILEHEDVGSDANESVALYRDLAKKEPKRQRDLLSWLESLGRED